MALFLFRRQDMGDTLGDGGDSAPACAVPDGSDYDDMGVRISSIFVILIGGLFGSMLPIISRRTRNKKFMPPAVFFIAKYFGSGVITATAFIHLLAPANEELTDPCLTGPITYYPWAEGIAFMMIFLLFFVELMIMRANLFENANDAEVDSDGFLEEHSDSGVTKEVGKAVVVPRRSSLVTPNVGEDHFSHARDHHDAIPAEDTVAAAEQGFVKDPHNAAHVHGSYDDYASQLTAIFILEFGIIFHSVFVGLTLALTPPDGFPVLYVVLVFHQTFEGMGLGTRVAITPWPKTRKGRWTPYLLSIAFALSTPICIAIGLGVRSTLTLGSQKALLVNGIFDSISAGILIYTGLVELMAHEFMFSENMRKQPLRVMLAAFGTMCLGAGLMALLGKWA